MCYIEHVLHNTCGHWKDRVTKECPRAKVVQGFTVPYEAFTVPCDNQEFIGMANAPGRCLFCIRKNIPMLNDCKKMSKSDSIVYSTAPDSGNSCLNQTDTDESGITGPRESNRPLERGKALEKVPKSKLEFLSWDEGFFQFPGCDAETQQQESHPQTNESEAPAKQAGHQNRQPKSALCRSRNYPQRFHIEGICNLQIVGEVGLGPHDGISLAALAPYLSISTSTSINIVATPTLPQPQQPHPFRAGSVHMPIAARINPRSALHAHELLLGASTLPRLVSVRTRTYSTAGSEQDGSSKEGQVAVEQGAMSRRLSQMSEESLETGGSSAKKAVAEAGFDEELRKRLEERIAAASFRDENPEAFARAELPTSAGEGTAFIAGAKPWTGTEVVEDTALRMLNDAYKPMKVTGRAVAPRIATRAPRGKVSPGVRLANAKDNTAVYSSLKAAGVSEKEREEYFKEIKARFQPEARAMPTSLAGLASLANERIEEAIARGQFKNLPRGKKIERDHNASSPFIDTTEYLMNKMIQKQDIVPPWIEKQQEVVAAVSRFRTRLRSDWKRHAARVIASAGGPLAAQIERAKDYAAAELEETASKPAEEAVSNDHRSDISLTGKLKLSTENKTLDESIPNSEQEQNQQESLPQRRPRFRDPKWESTERSFHNLTISSLNSLTRSYNLMAPRLAQKPYYKLERELKACYAEVAPLLAEEIRQRALAPKIKGFEFIGDQPGSLLNRFPVARAKVYDEDIKRKGYGFKQFWSDLWRVESA